MKTLASRRRCAALAAIALGLPAGRRAGADGQDRRIRREVGRGALVRHQQRSGDARRRRRDQQAGRRQARRRLESGKIVVDFLDDRCNAEEGISVLRRILRHRRRRRGRPDLLERRRAAVRHPAEEGRRQGRLRAADAGVHRRRDQGRPREDLGMGVPQRAERGDDVLVALLLAEDQVPEREDGLRRRGGGLRALARVLVRGDEGPRRGERLPGARRTRSGC